ncbi:CobW family GTP-binding protein [Kiloniella laminariae]|uniref:CobW family GTP-binding protein n=1 Tax=Kiloniella laminariae TaxID=454162 RepID=UPI000381A679|nr:GTP-binding protein [Kiloniella laminariae]
MSDIKFQVHDMDIPEEPLALSVLTGFLGSGKTTLLKQLLQHPAMDETAVIVNEFGEIGLDHLLVESSQEDIVLMNSGCLCCTVRGDLVETIRKLYKKRLMKEVPAFKRLVIETTGLADPAPILQTLMTDPFLSERFRLDGVITTVDALNGNSTLDNHPESVKQVAVADRLLVTKTDMAAERKDSDLLQRIKALNPTAAIQQVSFGKINPADLFNAGLYNPETKSLDVQKWLKAEAFEETSHGHHHDHDDDHHGHGHAHHHDVNRHDDKVHAFCLTHDKPIDWDQMNSWIDMLITLYGNNILRIKGILNVEGDKNPIVIHGVQHVFHPPVMLESWPDEDRRSKLVFIVRDLKRDMFDETFRAFIEESTDLH